MVKEVIVAATMIAGNCENCSWTATTTSTLSHCWANGEFWFERGFVCHMNNNERILVNYPAAIIDK